MGAEASNEEYKWRQCNDAVNKHDCYQKNKSYKMDTIPRDEVERKVSKWTVTVVRFRPGKDSFGSVIPVPRGCFSVEGHLCP